MPARIVIVVVLILISVSVTPRLLAQDPSKPKRVAIEIVEQGFTPESVTVEKGKPIELAFTRKTDKTCAVEIAIPSMKLKKALPLNEVVVIEITPDKDDITFQCGMNMLKGKLVVK
jgi:plastocyanin domain-containing protein